MPEPTPQQKQAMAMAMEAHLQAHLDKCPKLTEIIRWCALAQATGNDGSADVRLLKWAAREIMRLRDRLEVMETVARDLEINFLPAVELDESVTDACKRTEEP